ncbi:MAG: hypothetical protein ACJA0H_001014 [Francisellaceae bacterium]|jgi:hypothetical protein
MYIYNSLSSLLFINVCFWGLLHLFIQKKQYNFYFLLALSILSLIPFAGNYMSLVNLVSGMINTPSISSIILAAVILFSYFKSDSVRVSMLKQYDFALIAMFPVIIFIYFLPISVVGFFTYSFGYNPLILMIVISSYALVLLLISRDFLLFNIICLLAIFSYQFKFLGHNFWNYLIDPVIVIMLVVCVLSLIVKAVLSKCFYNKHA